MSRKRLSVFLFLILLCACSSPSEEAVQTAIAQTENAEAQIPDSVIQTAIAKTESVKEPIEEDVQVVEETPEPEAQDCDIYSPFKEDWNVVFCDTFDDNGNGWDLGSDSGDLSRSIYSIEGGKFVVDLTGKATSGYLSGVIQWIPIMASEDFVITLKGDVFSSFKSVSWGIIFNEKDYMNFSAFMIGNRDGTYYLTKYEDGDQTFPISGRSHSAIIWDEENELTIVASNGYYQFYINGEFVNDYEANDIPGTAIALTFWTGEGVTARFEFDDLLIKVPDPSDSSNLLTFMVP